MSSNQYLPPGNQYESRDDEIDLTELLTGIWATRWRVVLAVLTALALYGAYLAVGVVTADAPVRYEQVFELNFDGLETGEYPDGSPFVLSGIVSQAVLSRVHEQNDLSALDITVGDLRRSLSIEPYSAEFPLIRARYEQRLANEDLSATEIGELESDMRDALSLSSAGSIRISMDLPPDSPLDAPQVESLLKDIPRVWADRAINELGVLDLNEAVYSSSLFASERYMRVDYPVAIDLLEQNIGLLRDDVESLQERPYANDVRDPETGDRLLDIDKALSDILAYDLRSIFDPIRELGLTRDRETAELYLSTQLREVEQEREFWQERAAMTRRIIGSGESPRNTPSGDADITPSPSDPRMAMSAQIDGSFLDRLMEIAEQGDSEAFRQSLMRQVLEFEEKALSAKQRKDRIERSLTAVRGDGAPESVRQSYREQIEEQLPASLEALREYTSAVQRIREQISRRATGSISELVTSRGGSFEVRPASLLPARVPLMATAIAFLTGFVTMFLSLLADAMRRRREAKVYEG